MPPVPVPPRFEERPIPDWQKLVALVVAVAAVAAVGLWHDRLRSDFWPPDASRIAPNLVASILQAAIVLAVAAVLWPPARRRIRRFVTAHTEPLHDHFYALHRRHDDLLHRYEELHEDLRDSHAALLASHEALQEKLDALHAAVAKPKPTPRKPRKEPPAA